LGKEFQELRMCVFVRARVRVHVVTRANERAHTHTTTAVRAHARTAAGSKILILKSNGHLGKTVFLFLMAKSVILLGARGDLVFGCLQRQRRRQQS